MSQKKCKKDRDAKQHHLTHKNIRERKKRHASSH